MVWSGALFRPRRTPSLAAILEERMWQCKAMPAGKVNDLYASQSRISAMAAGAACTNRILRLTVTAP